MVDRYSVNDWPYVGCFDDKEGDWVTYYEYEKLESENTRLAAEVEALKCADKYNIRQIALEDVCRELTQAQAEVEKLRNNLQSVADYIEPHWRGAGEKLEGDWLLKEIISIHQNYENEVEKLQAENEFLKAQLQKHLGYNYTYDWIVLD